MAVRCIVRQRQSRRIEDARLGTETLEQARSFLYQQATVGALPVRAIEQQDAWPVFWTCRQSKLVQVRHIQQIWVDIGQIVVH